MNEVTRIRGQIAQSDNQAAATLLPPACDELRKPAVAKIAVAKITQEQPAQMLQATAFVHRVFMPLLDQAAIQGWNGLGHFYLAAAKALSRILNESARKEHAIRQEESLHRDRHPANGLVVDCDRIPMPKMVY